MAKKVKYKAYQIEDTDNYTIKEKLKRKSQHSSDKVNVWITIGTYVKSSVESEINSIQDNINTLQDRLNDLDKIIIAINKIK